MEFREYPVELSGWLPGAAWQRQTVLWDNRYIYIATKSLSEDNSSPERSVLIVGVN